MNPTAEVAVGAMPGLEKPDAILLASDLSPRSDRALDRALALARQWQARLVVLTVAAESVHAGKDEDAPDALALARHELFETVGRTDVPVSLHVATGPVGERILALAEAEGCGLIVTGVARREALGRVVLGSTVDELVRHARIPLLVVRRRVHGDYRGWVVASDFSDAARKAMQTAEVLFPQATPYLLHGYDVPFHGLLDAGRDATVQALGESARAQALDFLQTSGLPEQRIAATTLAIGHGDPAQLLQRHARDYPVDLAVIGSHGRSALYDALIGSVATRILDQSPLDTLVVR